MASMLRCVVQVVQRRRRIWNISMRFNIFSAFFFLQFPILNYSFAVIAQLQHLRSRQFIKVDARQTAQGDKNALLVHLGDEDEDAWWRVSILFIFIFIFILYIFILNFFLHVIILPHISCLALFFRSCPSSKCIKRESESISPNTSSWNTSRFSVLSGNLFLGFWKKQQKTNIFCSIIIFDHFFVSTKNLF
jgi:hypothetical protein